VTGGGDERLVAVAELGDPAPVDTADVDPAVVEGLLFAVVDPDRAEDDVDGGAELDCVIEVAPEDALETVDEAGEVDSLEDGAAEDEGGLLLREQRTMKAGCWNLHYRSEQVLRHRLALSR